MKQKPMNNPLRRTTAAGLSLLLLTAPALAAAPTPTCDEALYITLDPYGVAKESSIVKSYLLNGATSITDRGDYSEVTNLTNYAVPMQTESTVTFDFGNNAPDRFYFEGVTDLPAGTIPWTIDVSYLLNGVPTAAEDLAGASGLVQIDIDLVPNPDAPDYFRNNLMLQAATIMDADKILSLEAEGAQLQSIGNLKTVVFMALPGETQHFTIRIGSEDFSFGGLTFLMIPATVAQLEQITQLREVKDQARTAADAISESMDVLLGTMNQMQSSLLTAASGLDALNDARAIFSDGKGGVYTNIDQSLADLTALSEALTPTSGHLAEAQTLLTDLNTHLNDLTGTANSLHPELENLRRIIRNTQTDIRDLRNMTDDLSGLAGAFQRDLSAMNSSMDTLTDSLNRLQSALNSINISGSLSSLIEKQEIDLSAFSSQIPQGTTMTVGQIRQVLSAVSQVESAYRAEIEAGSIDPSTVDFQTYASSALAAQGVDSAAIPLYLGIYQERAAVESKLNEISNTISSLSGPLNDIANRTATVCRDLSNLLDTLGGEGLGRQLEKMMKIIASHEGTADALLADLNEAGDLLTNVSLTADTALTQLDGLTETLNTNEPLIQQSLEDAKTLSDTAVTGLTNLNTLLTNVRGLSERTGMQLDPGVRQTISGTAAALRTAASGLDQTGILQRNNDILHNLLSDELDDLESESNLLEIDPYVSPVSLTSDQNPAPQSLQIVLRTEEITKDDADKTVVEQDEDFHASGNVFTRIGAIFTSIKNAVAGLFS